MAVSVPCLLLLGFGFLRCMNIRSADLLNSLIGILICGYAIFQYAIALYPAESWTFVVALQFKTGILFGLLAPILSAKAKWDSYSESRLSIAILDTAKETREVFITWGPKRIFHQRVVFTPTTFFHLMVFIVSKKKGINAGLVSLTKQDVIQEEKGITINSLRHLNDRANDQLKLSNNEISLVRLERLKKYQICFEPKDIKVSEALVDYVQQLPDFKKLVSSTDS